MALRRLVAFREPVDDLLKLDYRLLIGLHVHIALAHPIIGVGGKRRGGVLLHELREQGHRVLVCPFLKGIEALFIEVFRGALLPRRLGAAVSSLAFFSSLSWAFMSSQ